MQFLTLEQLRTAQETGAIRGVTLRAEGGTFQVLVETLRGIAALVKTRKTQEGFEVRRFPDPGKALLLLHELGITEARVDGAAWTPNVPADKRRTRPDRAAVLKAAHAALSYTDWLEEKVQAARDGLADGSNPRIHAEDWEKIRAAKIAQRKAG